MWFKSIRICERPDLSAAVTEWSRQGLPCILLHGFGEASCVWGHLAVRLAPRFRVIGMDLRGHGDSDWDPDARYDTATFTSDLDKVIAAFGFERVVLIGHSLGADVAIRYAAANASRVAATVIVDFGPDLDQRGIDEVIRSFGAMPHRFGSLDAYVQTLLASRPMGNPSSLRHLARGTLHQSSPDVWELKADRALAQRSEIGSRVAQDGRYRSPDLWPMLARIDCPSLVVRGSASGVFPYDVATRMVEQTMPDARLATIGIAGHAVMIDNPAEFSAAVMDFLASVTA